MRERNDQNWCSRGRDSNLFERIGSRKGTGHWKASQNIIMLSVYSAWCDVDNTE